MFNALKYPYKEVNFLKDVVGNVVNEKGEHCELNDPMEVFLV